MASSPEEMFIGNKYVVDSVRVEGKELTEGRNAGKKSWDTLDVTVSKMVGGVKEKVGSYQRNYSHLYDTFLPFVHKGKEYALYSPNYMFTQVMELPSCRDIGEKEIEQKGYLNHFCPMEFYVPFYRKATLETRLGRVLDWTLGGDECFDTDLHSRLSVTELGPIEYCEFGFVAGCCWGDDNSSKIRYLDLSKIEQGIITVDDRFGYVELPSRMNLKDAIEIVSYGSQSPKVFITHTELWDCATGKKDGEEEE